MMQQELRLKLGAPGRLECPVDGCAHSSGRIRGAEVRRDLLNHSAESVSIGLECARGHSWTITIEEIAGELAYCVEGPTPQHFEDVPRSVGRVFDYD